MVNTLKNWMHHTSHELVHVHLDDKTSPVKLRLIYPNPNSNHNPNICPNQTQLQHFNVFVTLTLEVRGKIIKMFSKHIHVLNYYLTQEPYNPFTPSTRTRQNCLVLFCLVLSSPC